MAIAAGSRNASGNMLRASECECRDGDIGQIIDNQIEANAAEAWQHLVNLGGARERTVNAIDDEREPKPNEHLLPAAVRGGDQRHQGKRGAARGEDMNQACTEARAHCGSFQRGGRASEVPLDLAEHGDVAAFIRNRVLGLSLLVVSIKQFEADIELRQNAQIHQTCAVGL